MPVSRSSDGSRRSGIFKKNFLERCECVCVLGWVGDEGFFCLFEVEEGGVGRGVQKVGHTDYDPALLWA